MVTRQVRAGDMIRIDWNEESQKLVFAKVAEGLPFSALMAPVECDVAVAETASSAAGARKDKSRSAAAPATAHPRK